MKNKTKLVLGLSAMLAVTGGVAATSTFAWFTTYNTATAVFTNAKVDFNDQVIAVGYKAVDDSTWATEGTNTSVTSHPASQGFNAAIHGRISNQSSITDISGDGKTMYRPTWNANSVGSSASAIGEVVNSVGQATPSTNFVRYSLAFKNEGTVAVDIRLTSLSITKGADNPASEEAVKATRVSIWTGGDYGTMTSCLGNFQTEADDTGYNYIVSAASGISVYGVNSRTTNTLVSSADLGASNIHVGAITGGTQKLTEDLAINSTFYITITQWIEGTNKFADNDCLGGLVGLSLGFDAVTHA